MIKIIALAFIFTISLAAPTLSGNFNTVMLNSDVTLKYSIITNNMINKQAILTNQGDIAVGLGGTMMAGVDVAHLWWDDQKVQIVDRNYINPTTPAVILTDTERNGTNNFIGLGSTFDTAIGNWVATFNRKLNTGDMYDNVVADGGQIQLSVAKFSSQTWGAKHSAAYYQTVKLTSQASNAIKMTMDDSALFSFAALILIVLLALFGEN